MALKYFFEFYDYVNIKHRCEIYNEDYTDDPIEVRGTLSLSKAETEDTLEAIRGTGLSVNLEANTDLTFDDIYTSDERIYSIKYIRDSVIMFYGWMSPSDIYESYVDNEWEISIDCIDGLGFLKNLSYVENDTGFPFTYRQTGLEIIVNCLKRTNLSQKINTSIDIHYEGLNTSLNVLSEIYFNSYRFIKEDENTYMDCEEVLRSVLEIFGACITQKLGEWFIYKPNTFFGSSERVFSSYDSDGVFLENKTIQLSETIGSHQNGFYPHYINENQQISSENPIGAFKINYKYGVASSYFDNISLESSGDPPTVSEWNIDDYSLITFPPTNYGFYLNSVNDDFSQTLIIHSDPVPLDIDSRFNFKTKMMYFDSNPPSNPSRISKFLCVIVLTNGIDTYTLDGSDGTWSSSTIRILRSSPIGEEYTFSVQSEPTPIDGDVYIELYSPIEDGTRPEYNSYYNVIECGMDVVLDLDDLKGENHSLQVITSPSTKIQPIKTVFNGDNTTKEYVGAIYKNDNNTPTENWFRAENPTRLVPLLRIMGEERMKMYNKPLRVFSGDIYGFIEYMGVVTLDGFEGIEFMCIEYNYIPSENITQLKLKQILNNDIGDSDFSGLEYTLSYDYGTVVSPTITG